MSNKRGFLFQRHEDEIGIYDGTFSEDGQFHPEQEVTFAVLRMAVEFLVVAGKAYSTEFLDETYILTTIKKDKNEQ